MSPRSVSISPYLARRPKPGHARAGQPLAKVDRQRSAQVGAARLDPVDAPALEHARKAADGGLDFGKLGHRRDMAEAPQAR